MDRVLSEIFNIYVCCYTKEDAKYFDQLMKIKMFDWRISEDIGICKSYDMRTKEIYDQDLTPEQIKELIRQNYTHNPTVLVVLCGKHTKNRKNIDWEIYTAMQNDPNYPQMGILVINLPEICKTNEPYPFTYPEAKIMHKNGCGAMKTKEQFLKSNPNLPERIIDNLVKCNPITVVNWSDFIRAPYLLLKLIRTAHARREKIKYDSSTPLMMKNGINYD